MVETLEIMVGTIVFNWWTDFAGPSHSISGAGAGCRGTTAQAVHDKVGAGQMQQLKSIVLGSSGTIRDGYGYHLVMTNIAMV